MRVLSFPNFAKNRAAAAPQDWSQQEIADFYRAHRLLVENGAGIGIDRGVTDIGEPWIVFYDLASQDVFMHVARIDNSCLLICESLSIKLKASTISNLIIDFEIAVRDHLSVRTERHSNVVLHPAAKIIMSISAIFLLFKLDNSGVAYAKDMPAADHAPGATDATAKKADASTPTVRVQTALGRLFDTVDTPRAVASLAGVILTSELLLNMSHAQPELQAEQHHADDFIALPTVAAGEVAAAGADATVTVEHPHQEVTARETETHRTIVAVPVTAAVEQGQHEAISDHGLDNPVAAVTTTSSTANVPVEIQVAISIDPAPVSPTEASKLPVTSETAATEMVASKSVLAIENLLGVDLQEGQKLNVGAAVTPVADTAAPTPIDVPVAHTDISLAGLDQLDDVVGFYRTSTLSDTALTDMLVHFLTSMQNYEIEYVGGRILIEQDHVSDLASHDIGLWTNVMADGSSISIVGQATLIDDIAALVAA